MPLDNSLALQKKPLKNGQHPLEAHHLSHDLRGPLNSILGFSELLLEGIEGPLNDMQAEDIKAIYQSAKNLLLLINNIVDLSKLQAQAISFEIGIVDLEHILRGITHIDFGIAKPPALAITVAPPPNTASFLGDATRIEQMILNLIRFSFKKKRSGEINISATCTPQVATLTVAMSDVEISEAEQAILFDLGVTVDATGRSELGPGGLELPLARLLAESQNGQIQVESNARLGTIFTAQIPISESNS